MRTPGQFKKLSPVREIWITRTTKINGSTSGQFNRRQMTITTVDEYISEIERLIGVHRHTDADLIKIECLSRFEPHGRASETWEVVWRLVLPTVKSFYRLTDGVWRAHASNVVGTHFQGRTLMECLQEAVTYLRECPQSLDRNNVVPVTTN